MSPAAALAAPPDTGASSIIRPCSLNPASMERASSAEIVDDTITAVPGLSLGARALVAEQYRLALGRVDDQQQDGIELFGETAGIRRDFDGAGLFEFGAGSFVQVDTVGLKAGPDTGLRSPHAHGAKPDDADVESAD